MERLLTDDAPLFLVRKPSEGGMRQLVILCVFSTYWNSNAVVHAAEFAAAIGRTGHSTCQMDNCTFYVIDDAVPVGSTASGTLYAVSGREWAAFFKSRGENDEHEYDRPPISETKHDPFIEMVFCSKAKPIYFDFNNGKWESAEVLIGEPNVVFNANELMYEHYWAACHNYIVVDTDGQAAEIALAKKLGYNISASPSDADRDSKLQPFDVLR
jgi:hypothetical protein